LLRQPTRNTTLFPRNDVSTRILVKYKL
jgi:hypothetical protein